MEVNSYVDADGHSGWVCVDPHLGKGEQVMLGRKVC